MRRRVGFALSLLALILAGWVVAQAPAGSTASLAELLPAGAQLVLEAKDLSQPLRDWNSSVEKTRWLESDNYRAFSRSRLFLRLSEVHSEFAAGAGFDPDMDWVESVAGARSALALYDIGNLHFLYVTELASARAVETLLWQKRADFEPRSAAGQDYYVRTDEKSGRLVAFAATDDYLLLATREDLLPGALNRMFEQQGPSVVDEPWLSDAVAAAPAARDLRLVLNMEALARSPYLRSYWIQRNVSELAQYRAGVVDIHYTRGQIREERVFLRKETPGEEPPPPKPGNALPRLVRLVPGDAGLYRCWTAPDLTDAIKPLAGLLAPGGAPPPPPASAPHVRLTGGTVGTEGALETRIDEPPPKNVSGMLNHEGLRDLLGSTETQAVLEVGGSAYQQGNVFLGFETVLVLMGAAEWDGPAARQSLLTAVEGLWTTSRLGAQWVEDQAGGRRYHRLDGLVPLLVAIEGPYLAVSNSQELLGKVLGRLDTEPNGEPAAYAARFSHSAERGPFYRLMGQLDFAELSQYGAPRNNANRHPEFFSENIGSLSRTLSRVTETSIVSRDEGDQLKQTVHYEISP